MKPKPALSIIIPLRNTKANHRDTARLKNCLDSLAAQTAIDKLEVIVSDLGSDPYYKRKHAECVKRSSLKNKCKHIYTTHTGPFNISRARNAGLRAAAGEYVMVTDVDALFPPDFCGKLLATANLDRIVHCQIWDLPRDGDKARAVQRPPYCYGGCQVVSRKWAEEVHGWDEKFTGWGADDTDFKVRAEQAGKEAVWLNATFYHQWHEDSMAQDEYTSKNRARHELTKRRQLPIIRNPFVWGGKPAQSDADTCILITTFMRDNSLFQCVKLCKKFYPDMAIFVADCGTPTEEKTQFCDDYEVGLIQAPYDAGVSATRNLGMSQLPPNYAYIIILEDDVHLTPETHFGMWRRVLNSDRDIVVVGGLLKRVILGSKDTADQHYEATLEIKDRTLWVKEITEPKWKDGLGVRYHLADIILNVFMMRRFVWDEAKWDDRIKSAPEHCQWFLTLKQKTPYKVAYAPDVILEHAKNPVGEKASGYVQHRERKDGLPVFADNWDIDYLWSSWNERWGLANPMDLRNVEPDTVLVMSDNLNSAIGILNQHKCTWWLDAGTCLGTVRDKNFIDGDTDIDIGILAKDIGKWDKIRDAFIAAGFTVHKEWEHDGQRFELSVGRSGVKVDIFFYFPRGDQIWHGAYGLGRDNAYSDFLPHIFTASLFESLREITFRGLKCFIPNPPERYLAERYGAEWMTPDPNYLYWRDCQAIDKGLLKDKPEVYIGGVWDLLHIGHLNILERCKGLAGKGRLTVGILTDDAASRYKPRPIIGQDERLRMVAALSCVDDTVFQNDQDPTADFEALNYTPDYIVHGTDWDRVPGAEYVRRRGGRAVFLPYTPTITTTDIKCRVRERGNEAPVPMQNVKRGDKIAIGIKTFMREEALWKNLDAIKKHCPFPYRLYIADDGPISDNKKAQYKRLELEGHRIIRLPNDVGISAGRNAIFKAIDEGYIWLTDDDVTLVDSESLKRMRMILDGVPELGLIAAVIRDEISGNYFANENYAKGLSFVFPGGGLLKRIPAHRAINTVDNNGGPAFVYADQIPNCFLAKREVFDDVQWDGRIRIEFEHQDFFLNLMKTKWKAAVCLDAKAVHLNTNPEREYHQYRRTASPAYFLQKHKLSNIVNQF